MPYVICWILVASSIPFHPNFSLKQQHTCCVLIPPALNFKRTIQHTGSTESTNWIPAQLSKTHAAPNQSIVKHHMLHVWMLVQIFEFYEPITKLSEETGGSQTNLQGGDVNEDARLQNRRTAAVKQVSQVELALEGVRTIATHMRREDERSAVRESFYLHAFIADTYIPQQEHFCACWNEWHSNNCDSWTMSPLCSVHHQ